MLVEASSKTEDKETLANGNAAAAAQKENKPKDWGLNLGPVADTAKNKGRAEKDLATEWMLPMQLQVRGLQPSCETWNMSFQWGPTIWSGTVTV